MKERLLKLLDVEPSESERVFLLLAISFLMGLFLATVTVASQTLFLNNYDETVDLPIALAISGAFGLLGTGIYNFLYGRISIALVGGLSLLAIIALTAFI